MGVSVEVLYERWERELAQVYREPDAALVASLEAEAEAQGFDLLDIHDALTAASFDELLHPRGHDGKFIEKGGLVKLLNYRVQGKNGKAYDFDGQRGKVLSITPDKRDKKGPPDVRVGVFRPGQSDTDNPSTVITVKPSNIEQAPEKARLDDLDAPAAMMQRPAEKVPLPESTPSNSTYGPNHATITPEQAAAYAETVKAHKPVHVDEVDVDDVISNFADSPEPVDLTLMDQFAAMRASGIPRAEMPQIPKEHLQTFQDQLNQRGIHFDPPAPIDPRNLQATQAELDGKNVSGMMASARDGSFDLLKDPIWFSNDGHILDGHHRWAAATALSMNCGGCVSIPGIRVDMPISELLAFANAFNDSVGVERRAFGVSMPTQPGPQAAPAAPAVAAAGTPPMPQPDENGYYTMATDAEDGITDEDLVGLPYGVEPDGSAFVPLDDGEPPPGEEPMPASGLLALGGRFDELLHPRGHDGKFIEKFGLVKLVGNLGGSGGPGRAYEGQRARVVDITPDNRPGHKPDIHVQMVDGSGKPGGRTYLLKPENIEKAPEKARLSIKQRLAKMFGQYQSGYFDNGVYVGITPPSKPARPGYVAISAEQQRAKLTASINARTATLSTTDAQARSDGLNGILGPLRFSVIDTDRVHDHLTPPNGSGGRWDAEREAIHEQMWTDFHAQVEASGIPKNHDALVMGGLPGAGKTTALSTGAAQFGVTPWTPLDPKPNPTHVAINPDDFKTMLLQRGLGPDGLQGFKPMEESTFVHAESVYLSKKFAQRLSDEGYNIALDSTMATPDETRNRMTPLAHNGYNFRGLFVDIPVEESAESMESRYLANALTPDGERFVAKSVLSNRHTSTGNLSKNRDVFDQLAHEDWFTEYMAIDNTGVSQGNPRGEIVAQGTGTGKAALPFRAPFAAPVPSQGQHEIPGIGNVDDYLAAHPQEPGEAYFEWQSRIVDGLPPDSKHALLFETRERYEPVDYIAAGAARWRAEHNLPEPAVDLSEIPAPLDKANLVARAYEATPDQGNDPRVQQAFFAFKEQTEEMWDYMTKPESEGGLGIKIDFFTDPDPARFGIGPYANATEQAEDLRQNHHMSTEHGLGGAHELTMTEDEYDRFRAVHDVFGHAGIGGGFDRHGEYQAYLSHSSMYTGDGRRAMASEYHGVNTAMWGGEPGSPGTGKSILLPEELIPDPFDPATGEIIAASAAPEMPDETQLEILGIDEVHAEGLAYLAAQANIEPPFGQWYDESEWHALPPPPEETAPPAEVGLQTYV
jgi:Zeta toxin